MSNASTFDIGTGHCLSGVVVVERADRLAVSVCASLLAELGATVIRIGGTDRDIGLTKAARSRSAKQYVRGKSLAGEAGNVSLAEWHAWISRADVVLVGDRKSTDEDILDEEEHQRVICVVSAFSDGLTSGKPSFDEIALQARGGLMAATGEWNGAPQATHVPIVEMFTALNAATGILAALRMRRGGRVEVSGIDSALALLSTYVATVECGRHDGYRLGSGHHLCAPWNVYRTVDGWIQLCTTTDQHWSNLLQIIGQTKLQDDSRFASGGDRVRNAGVVDEIIRTWALTRSTSVAVRELNSADLPVGSVKTVREAEAGTREGASPGWQSFLGALSASCRLSEPDPVADQKHSDPTAMAERSVAVGASPPAMARPMSGIRVIEIGAYTAGPLGGRYLADLGAEVIKIETEGGEVSRMWQPQYDGYGGYFATCNSGKASAIVDFKTTDGRERFIELVRSADVIIENLRPGALDKLMTGPSYLTHIMPRLIYCSVSGFGCRSGGRPALDSVIQAESGLMELVGNSASPLRVGISIADQAAAHAIPLVVLAALSARAKSGQGQHIDLSMLNILLWMTELARPDGARAIQPVSMLATTDGWVAIGSDSIAGGTKDEVSNMSRNQAVSHFEAQGISAVGVLEMGEVFSQELVRRRGHVQFAPTDRGSTVPILSAPFRFGKDPILHGQLLGAPGADTERIFKRIRC